jgi:hypothetical protein
MSRTDKQTRMNDHPDELRLKIRSETGLSLPQWQSILRAGLFSPMSEALRFVIEFVPDEGYTFPMHANMRMRTTLLRRRHLWSEWAWKLCSREITPKLADLCGTETDFGSIRGEDLPTINIWQTRFCFGFPRRDRCRPASTFTPGGERLCRHPVIVRIGLP